MRRLVVLAVVVSVAIPMSDTAAAADTVDDPLVVRAPSLLEQAEQASLQRFLHAVTDAYQLVGAVEQVKAEQAAYEAQQQARVAAALEAAEAEAEADRLGADAEPEPDRSQAASISGSGSAVWDQLAACESGGDWSINTGNGYSGGLQWLPSTWDAYRDGNDPADAHDASREQQIAAAERLRNEAGFDPWPSCADQLGLR